jgi:(p)ppGpp synthase/HD superfamily hydrolase
MSSQRLADAFEYAAALHAGQKRKGGDIPYLSHLMAVAALVLENGGDEDQVIAALLHDGPEDQGGKRTLTEIRERFGDRAARIVEDCSDTFKTPKPAWKQRKLSYLEHLKSAPLETLTVSLADKVHNLGCIVWDCREKGDELWERFNTGREGTLWYYQQLCAVYETRRQPELERLLDDFTRSLRELEVLIQKATKGTA